MNGREMQIGVERLLQSASKSFITTNKINSATIFYYINRSQDSIINEYKQFGIERSEDIKSRLGKLFKEAVIDTSSLTKSGILDGIEVPLESDLWYVLSEFIIDSNSNQVKVKSVPRDYYNINKNNPFKKPELTELAWSFEKDGNRVLIYPGTISEYKYSYIKSPLQITNSNTSELNESVHQELVDRAFSMIIEKYNNTNN